MAGNTFGEIFRITTFGESHGKAIGVVIDGVIPNIDIDLNFVQSELNRRKPGQSSITTPRKEEDRVEILSGVFEGKTTGAPICLVIWNKDQNPKIYEQYKNIFRPGHAGYTFLNKYGIYDYYGGGRASGRETAARVAAGAIAKTILKNYNIEIIGYTRKVGNIEINEIDYNEIEKNDIRCPDKIVAKKMIDLISEVKSKGDSIGGVVEIVVKNCPIGLGDPVFDKLHADFAKALISIGAVKGFEIGAGFKFSEKKASEIIDDFYFDQNQSRIRTKTNNQGGILGGISNGEDIVMRIAIKSPSSILIEKDTVRYDNTPTKIKIEGRHDPCLCPRIIPVAESMIALVLLDKLLIQNMIKKTPTIGKLREQIDLIDKNILILIAERQKLVKEIGKEKIKNNLKILDRKRELDALSDRKKLARRLKLDTNIIEKLFKLLFKISKIEQEKVKVDK
jgi:chorismate synthase